MAFLVNSNQINKIIPDNSDTGLTDAIKITRKGKVKDLEVAVNISHNYSGDLEIYLQSPTGTSATLYHRTGSSQPNIQGVFKGEVLAPFNGEKAAGDWKLTVKDFAPRDQGTLNSWSLRMDCAEEDASEIFIPDGAGKKLVSKQTCEVAGNIKEISASVEIDHNYIGDLEVTLVGPGASVKLHDREGGNKKGLNKTYSSKQLKDFIGTKAKGTWTLEVADQSPRDAGRVKSWHVDLKV